MTATKTYTKVYWSATALATAVATGMKDSVREAGNVARVKNPWPSHIKVAAFVRGDTGYVIGKGPLAHIAEEGAEAHEIVPKGLTLTPTGRRRRGSAVFGTKRGLSHPFGGTIQHPGLAERPYIRPARDYWTHGGFQLATRRAMLRAGFK